LVEKEKAELAVLKALPAGKSFRKAQVEDVSRRRLLKTGSRDQDDMGKVMKAVQAKPVAADNRLVSQMSPPIT